MKLQGKAREQVEALEWCPPEYLPEYSRIKDGLKFRSAEARRIIEDHIAVVKRREERRQKERTTDVHAQIHPRRRDEGEGCGNCSPTSR